VTWRVRPSAEANSTRHRNRLAQRQEHVPAIDSIRRAWRIGQRHARRERCREPTGDAVDHGAALDPARRTGAKWGGLAARIEGDDISRRGGQFVRGDVPRIAGVERDGRCGCE
jgi:hypothetical protein